MKQLKEKIFPKFENIQAQDEILKLTEIKILVMIFLFYEVILSIVIPVRIFYLKESLIHISPLLITFATISVVLYCLIQKNMLGLGKFFFYFILLTTIPLRTYQTGGLDAPVIFSFVVIPIVTFILYGKKAGLLSFICIALAISSFIWVDVPSIALSKPFHAFTIIMLLLMILNPIIVLVQERNRLGQLLFDYQKNKENQEIMARMLHEVLNPVTMMMGNIQLIQKDQMIEKDQLRIDRCMTSLVKLDDVMKTLSKISKETDIGSVLIKYKKEIHIIEKIKKEVKDHDNFLD